MLEVLVEGPDIAQFAGICRHVMYSGRLEHR